MPKSKFEQIFRNLKSNIENETYPLSSMLPSENELAAAYSCSRNTIRRATAKLIELGYVQPSQGKGVHVIYHPILQNEFTIGGIESFQESAKRNKKSTFTKVIRLEKILATPSIAKRSGFPLNTPLYDLRRVRYVEGKPLILDLNLFLQSAVPNLTKEIAESSVYEYLEDTLGMTIVTSRRRLTVEHATEQDEALLDLGDYNCLAVITSQTYNSDGIQFEYTQSRHQPDYFCFNDTAIRKKP